MAGPIKGKKYECIQDVKLVYTKGEIYLSKHDGCITDNNGDDFHLWDDEDDGKGNPGEFQFSNTFKELE